MGELYLYNVHGFLTTYLLQKGQNNKSQFEGLQRNKLRFRRQLRSYSSLPGSESFIVNSFRQLNKKGSNCGCGNGRLSHNCFTKLWRG